MTIAELYNKMKETGNVFNSWWIPIKKDGKDIEFDLEIEGSNDDGWHVNIVNWTEK